MQGITMKRTDLQVRHDIQDELAWDPNLSARNIGVWVTDGIATLSGNVATQLEKSAAEIQSARPKRDAYASRLAAGTAGSTGLGSSPCRRQ